MDNFTFPIPLPVIMKDEKEYAEEEAWKEQEERQLKIQEETLKVQKKQLEHQVDFSDDSEKLNSMFADQIDLLGDIADKPAIKDTKEKQVKFWDKIFKNKVFESTLKGIKGIASSLGGGLFDTLIGLMMWAFIDPNGSLMISLINIFVSLSVMVIRMFAKMIPVVLKLILKILPVIIKAISEIINTIIDVLPDIIDSIVTLMPLIFNTLANAIPQIIVKLMDAVVLVINKLKDKFPMLEPVLKFIERLALAIKELFDPNSPLGIKERLLLFAKTLLIIFGEALLEGLQALIPLLGDLLVSLKDSVMESLNEMGNSVHNYLLEHLGVKGMKALEGFGIALGAIVGTMLAGAIAAGIWVTGIYLWTAAMWIKNVAILAGIPALLSFAAGMWATISPILAVIAPILAMIAVFVLLYTFWDEIAKWFSESWNWFVDNALDNIITGLRLLLLPFSWPIELGLYIYNNWQKISDLFFKAIDWFMENALDLLIIGLRALMLPWTWPIEAALYIYKNWEKIKKKLSDGIKAFQQMFPNISKTISDIFNGFKNIKIGDVGDMIYKAFDTALLGIPSLLRKAFSNIPGAETIRKGFEALEKWFKTTIFYDALKAAGMVGGNDEKPKTQFEKIFTTMKDYDSKDVINAQAKFKESAVDSELLKQVIIGGDIKRLGLSKDDENELLKEITNLKKSVGGEVEYKKLQQQIATSKNDEELSKAIYKLASKEAFTNIIGFVGNATISKSDKRGG